MFNANIGLEECDEGKKYCSSTSDREQPAGERRTEAEQEYIPEQPVEREGSEDFIRGSRTSRSGRQAPISAEVLIDTY